MVPTDSEMLSPGEVESPLQSNQQSTKNQQPFPSSSIGRQSSIYSLTLDEFQSTLCDSGKNFGSMNMDEFLNSIWTAEENQAQAQGVGTSGNPNTGVQFRNDSWSKDKGLAKQPSLPRQGSICIPEPLCRKTVDEVWSEIHKDENHKAERTAQRQTTFGEMTLEDFLIRAGVVREQNYAAGIPPPYGMYPNANHPGMGPNFVARPVMGIAGPPAAGYQAVPQSGVGEASFYPGGTKRGGGYAQGPSGIGYGGRMGNGSGGFGQVQGLGIGSPVSPVSSEGLCGNQMDMSGMRGGRKRIIDGPVEKVVERRQRRMIKNRESAARSRARKQAYTVELEAELNQLKEENSHLKQALADLERKRKQQYYEASRTKVQILSKAQKANERLRVMRRTLSGPC